MWGGLLIGILALMAVPQTNRVFVSLTLGHPYLMSFGKFFVLATMGELLGQRIVSGRWSRPPGLGAKMLVWGMIGILIMLTFEIFSQGVQAVLKKGLLPGGDNRLVAAFYTSLVANITFGPVFMIFHRFSDTFIEVRCASGKKPSLKEIINMIDWYNVYSFVVLTTIPVFWIPAHTLTFYLPGEYRMICAALLSIVIGAILSFASKKGQAGIQLSPAKGVSSPRRLRPQY